MKKNWMQVATFCLCCVLLVVTVVQGWQIRNLQRQMENKLEHEMDSLHDQIVYGIQDVSNNMEWYFEEANRVFAECSLQPSGVDKESRSLLVEVSLALKEWHEDTEVVLSSKTGAEEETWQQFLPTVSEGNGRYSGQIPLPLDSDGVLSLEALVIGGGVTKKEALQEWSEIAMLLPLRKGGGDWSSVGYFDGVMSGQFDIVIEGQEGSHVSVRNPQFLTYRNGELVQTQEAVENQSSFLYDGLCYTVDTEDNEWSLPCDVGDVIDIRFRCEDEHGLGYDFPFKSWVVKEGPGFFDDRRDSVPLTLYLPE